MFASIGFLYSGVNVTFVQRAEQGLKPKSSIVLGDAAPKPLFHLYAAVTGRPSMYSMSRSAERYVQ